MASSSSSANGSRVQRRSSHQKVTPYWLWYKKTLKECSYNEEVAREKASTTWTSLFQGEKDGWKRLAKDINAANRRPQPPKETPEERAA
jgi:hypothetical protein